MSAKKKTHPSATGSGAEGELPPGFKLRHILRGHTGEIRRIAWSPEGRRLASPSSDRTVRVWDTETGKLLHVLSGHDGIIYSAAWSPDGKLIASGSEDNSITLWHVGSGGLVRVLHGHGGWVNALAWHPARFLLPAPRIHGFLYGILHVVR
jgi:WD40 repeat protein